jgi:hypothetical protein
VDDLATKGIVTFRGVILGSFRPSPLMVELWARNKVTPEQAVLCDPHFIAGSLASRQKPASFRSLTPFPTLIAYLHAVRFALQEHLDTLAKVGIGPSYTLPSLVAATVSAPRDLLEKDAKHISVDEDTVNIASGAD